RTGRPTRLVLHANDADERRAAEHALHDLEVRDEQTGVFRRREFERRLARRLRRLRDPGALVLVDIDDFRSVNRTSGRAAGDRVLRTVAKAIAGAVSADALVGRIAGDVFGVFAGRQSLHETRAPAAAPVDAIGAW